MTRSSIRAKIRQDIEDQGSFYTNEDLNNAIQECYTQYALETRVIEKKVTLNFQDDLVYYNFKSLVPDFLYIIAIYNNNTRSWLLGKDTLWLDGIRMDWETMTGNARWLSIINPEIVALVPTLETAVGDFTLYYTATAPILTSDSEVLTVFNDSDKAFISYANFYLMLQAREFTKAKLALQGYREEINKIKLLMQSRGLPTRRYGLKG